MVRGEGWAAKDAAVAGLAFGLVLAAGCGGAPREERAQPEGAPPAAAAAPSVRIVEPEESALVSGPDLHVVLFAEGIEVVPATERQPRTGHHHLFMETDLSPPHHTIPRGVTWIIHLGRGHTEFTIQGLAPGEHRVIALIADADHIP